MDNQLEHNYNMIVGAFINNIVVLSEKNEMLKHFNIALKNFNPKDKEHLFFLEVTKIIVSQLENIQIYLDAKWSTRLKLWWPHRKYMYFYGKTKKNDVAIDVKAELENLRGFATSLCGKDFNFGDIYTEFYERK